MKFLKHNIECLKPDNSNTMQKSVSKGRVFSLNRKFRWKQRRRHLPVFNKCSWSTTTTSSSAITTCSITPTTWWGESLNRHALKNLPSKRIKIQQWYEYDPPTANYNGYSCKVVRKRPLPKHFFCIDLHAAAQSSYVFVPNHLQANPWLPTWKRFGE